MGETAARIRELEDRLASHERMLRSLATLCEAVAAGIPLTDVMAQTATRIRDHLEPRRGMANGRR